MTHPDTLTIQRAVVEQALEALDLSYALLESAKSYHRPKVLDAYKNLRAALQPQAADPRNVTNVEDAILRRATLRSGKVVGKKAAAEPVATMWREKNTKLYPGVLFDLTEAGKDLPLGVRHQLYATPPATQAALTAALKKDAARYRWMWNHAHSVSFTYQINSHTKATVMNLHCGSLQETIDAAIAQIEARKGPQ